MLQQVRLENFKGFKKAQIDVGRITVLIGPNGTGKSSISHALMVLRQSIGANELIVNGPLINLGDFRTVLNREAANGRVQIGVSIGVAGYKSLNIPQNASFSYDAYFVPRLAGFDAAISSPRTKYYVVKLEQGQATVQPPEPTWKFAQSREIKIKLNVLQQVAIPVGIRKVSHSEGLENKAAALREKLNELFSAVNRVLNNTYYVHAIRGFERPEYELDTNPAMDFQPGGNARLASTFAYAGRGIEEIVSTWSESITGSDLASVLIPGRKVGIESYAVPEGIPLIGDGFGTNQLFQLLLTLALTPEKSLLAIEEPEIHLHPKAQKKLCDILLQTAKEEDKQIIVTTHSEHILFSFVSAVRNGTLTRDELTIYCFEEKGQEPRKVEQDEYGDIYEWDKNFFYWT